MEAEAEPVAKEPHRQSESSPNEENAVDIPEPPAESVVSAESDLTKAGSESKGN